MQHYHEISLHIDEFLGQIVDMNNPLIKDVPEKIKEILGVNEQQECTNELFDSKEDIFEKIGIEKNYTNSKPTDLEVNQFIDNSYKNIVFLFSRLCKLYENENSDITINCESIDSRNNLFQFYRSGNLVRGLRIFKGNMFGRVESIFISENSTSFGGNHSWNGQYDGEVSNGQLKLFSVMSLGRNNEPMEAEDVVKDIWVNYVQIYLKR